MQVGNPRGDFGFMHGMTIHAAGDGFLVFDLDIWQYEYQPLVTLWIADAGRE